MNFFCLVCCDTKAHFLKSARLKSPLNRQTLILDLPDAFSQCFESVLFSFFTGKRPSNTTRIKVQLNSVFVSNADLQYMPKEDCCNLHMPEICRQSMPSLMNMCFENTSKQSSVACSGSVCWVSCKYKTTNAVECRSICLYNFCKAIFQTLTIRDQVSSFRDFVCDSPLTKITTFLSKSSRSVL